MFTEQWSIFPSAECVGKISCGNASKILKWACKEMWDEESFPLGIWGTALVDSRQLGIAAKKSNCLRYIFITSILEAEPSIFDYQAKIRNHFIGTHITRRSHAWPAGYSFPLCISIWWISEERKFRICGNMQSRRLRTFKPCRPSCLGKYPAYHLPASVA